MLRSQHLTFPDKHPFDPIEHYFNRLYQLGWARVESLLTKQQIEESVSADFVNGVFLAAIVALLERDEDRDHPTMDAARAQLEYRYGGLQGVIGELVRRMYCEWVYIPTQNRVAEDYQSADLARLFARG